MKALVFPIVIDTGKPIMPLWDIRVVWRGGAALGDRRAGGAGLGLGHSDSESDIMYPRLGQDAAQHRASARDFRTIDALYSLPNGASLQ